MAYSKWVLIGLVWALVALINSTSSDELKSPVVMALRRGCTTNTECDENHYCDGKGHTKRCQECFDCDKVKRNPRVSYDGSSCAKHQYDCGECYEGFEVLGGVCSPIQNTSADVAPVAKVGLSNSQDDTHNGFKHQDEAQTSSSFWTVLIALGIFLIFVVGSLIIYIINKGLSLGHRLKRGIVGTEEETTLTSVEGHLQPIDRPTAPPPDEYEQQPPFAPPTTQPGGNGNVFQSNVRRFSRSPKRVSFKKLQASPFQPGNQAGDWNTEEDDRSRQPDEVDNQPGSTQEGLRAPQEGDGSVEQPMGNEPRPGPSRGRPLQAEGQMGRATANISRRARRYSQPRSGATSGSLIRPQGLIRPVQQMDFEVLPPGGPASEDPQIPQQEVMASFAANIWVSSQFSRDFRQFNDVPGNGPPPETAPQRFAISAPPSPRQIDDTYIGPLEDLEGSFQTSNISLDSGTGTNADRSLPSRSTSGNDVRRGGEFSDMDDSMYDFEVPSPGTLFSDREEQDEDLPAVVP